MTKKSTAGKIGRDARNGQYISVSEARRRPSTTIVETRKPTKPVKPRKR